MDATDSPSPNAKEMVRILLAIWWVVKAVVPRLARIFALMTNATRSTTCSSSALAVMETSERKDCFS